MSPDIRDAVAADLPQILEITNEAIRNTTAVWTLTPATLDQRRAWLDERQGRGFPVLVAASADRVLGFASFGDFRAFEGYRQTVEHSIYVDPAAHGRGLGRALLEELISRARAMDKHVMVGVIDATNAVSIGLHRAAGFEETGRMREVGRKFDRWLDAVLMQKML